MVTPAEEARFIALWPQGLATTASPRHCLPPGLWRLRGKDLETY
jgi:hypothetical protein